MAEQEGSGAVESAEAAWEAEVVSARAWAGETIRDFVEGMLSETISFATGGMIEHLDYDTERNVIAIRPTGDEWHGDARWEVDVSRDDIFGMMFDVAHAVKENIWQDAGIKLGCL